MKRSRGVFGFGDEGLGRLENLGCERLGIRF